MSALWCFHLPPHLLNLYHQLGKVIAYLWTSVESGQTSYRSRLAIRTACRVRSGSLVMCSISHIRRGSDRGVRSEVASLLALEDEIALLKGELSGMGVEKGIETYLIEPGVDTF